jgi:hypothetical protein
VVIALVVVGVIQLVRAPSVRLAAFIGAIGVGEWLLTRELKDLVGRTRPTVTAGAAALGPAVPSGHSAGAAAFYAAIARRGDRARPTNTGDSARSRGRHRGRGRRVTRAARRALGERRGRRARARLGLVRAVRRRGSVRVRTRDVRRTGPRRRGQWPGACA